MSKKDKIIGDLLTAGIALGSILVYFGQRRLIKSKDEIIEDQYKMLDRSIKQNEELIDICGDLLGYDEKDKEKLQIKAGFTVMKTGEES